MQPSYFGTMIQVHNHKFRGDKVIGIWSLKHVPDHASGNCAALGILPGFVQVLNKFLAIRLSAH